MIMRSWAEIDLRRIRENYELYKAALAPGQKVMAVVKADAYGHGHAEISRLLEDAGVDFFAVSNITEALELRQAGIKGNILILGYTPANCAEMLVQNDITQAVLSPEYAEALAAQGQKVKVHFALDTGMNRIGLDGDKPAETARLIRAYADKLAVEGLFTHLCAADTPAQDAFTEAQIAKFTAVADAVRDLSLPYIHYMNSAAGIAHNNGKTVYARLGILLYGLKPADDFAAPAVLPALSWKTVISMVKDVLPGEKIGYGLTYEATRPMRVATLPTGYADGYRRALSNKGVVYIAGQPAPIVGRICMDQMMVDVTDIPEAVPGAEVSLLCDEYTADRMAADIDTIGYEIICGISKRVEREYK